MTLHAADAGGFTDGDWYMMRASDKTVVLASRSRTRAVLLQQAGVQVVVDPADVDEAAIKTKNAGLAIDRVAEALAEAKARAVAPRHPDALVLGVDQMLECGSQWLDKPLTRAVAQEQLELLRGQKHRLVTSVVIVRNEDRIWHTTDHALLTMRVFSDKFLEKYLDTEGETILGSVGAYRLEGTGAQMFSKVIGDYFTVLGLPLLPLLEYLRIQGVLLV